MKRISLIFAALFIFCALTLDNAFADLRVAYKGCDGSGYWGSGRNYAVLQNVTIWWFISADRTNGGWAQAQIAAYDGSWKKSVIATSGTPHADASDTFDVQATTEVLITAEVLCNDPYDSANASADFEW